MIDAMTDGVMMAFCGYLLRSTVLWCASLLFILKQTVVIREKETNESAKTQEADNSR